MGSNVRGTYVRLTSHSHISSLLIFPMVMCSLSATPDYISAIEFIQWDILHEKRTERVHIYVFTLPEFLFVWYTFSDFKGIVEPWIFWWWWWCCIHVKDLGEWIPYLLFLTLFFSCLIPSELMIQTLLLLMNESSLWFLWIVKDLVWCWE